jgi:hypothetical protein
MQRDIVRQGRLRGVKERWRLAVVAGVAIAAPFAEGTLKNGWIAAALLLLVGGYVLMSQWSRVLENTLLVVIAVCLTLTGLDLLLRPLIGHKLHFSPLNVHSRRLPQLPLLGRWNPTITLDFLAFGDLAAMAGDPSLREYRRIAFETDHAGFRNRPISASIDVVVLGDSFGAGAGTTQAETFSSLLDTRYGCRTYNLAFPGGPYFEYLNAAIELPRLPLAPHATLLWSLFTGNDLDDPAGDIWEIEQLPWQSGLAAWLVQYRTFRSRSPLRQWFDALVVRKHTLADQVIQRQLPDGRRVLFMRQQESAAGRSREEVERHENFPRIAKTMAAMRTLASRYGLELILAMFPTKGEVYSWLLHDTAERSREVRPSGFAEAVLAVCKDLRMRCLDTKPFLREEADRLFSSAGKLLWWLDDTHFGTLGNAAVAAVLGREVLQGGCHSSGRGRNVVEVSQLPPVQPDAP